MTDLSGTFPVDANMAANYRLLQDVVVKLTVGIGQTRLTLLSTWLGHVHPANTYWYLSASP